MQIQFGATSDSVHVDPKIYTQLVDLGLGKLQELYNEKLNIGQKMLAKQVTRSVLYAMEDKLDGDLRTEIRPTSGADPVLHLMNFVAKYAVRMIEDANIEFDIRDGTLIAVSIQPTNSGESRG